jgi:hypothetical protein
VRAWLRICAALALPGAAVAWSAGLVPNLASQPLAWHAQDWLARPWTLWTAAWVHPSAGSLVGNLLALAALAVVGAWLRMGAAAATALYVAWPLATLGLLLWPGVAVYGGLGGAIHAAAMVLWAELALRPDAKPLSFALAAGLGLKLLVEHAWTRPLAFDPEWGINVAYAAHLTGAAAGAVCGLAAAAIARVRRAPGG